MFSLYLYTHVIYYFSVATGGYGDVRIL